MLGRATARTARAPSQGWPAVLALAAGARDASAASGVLPSALHSYLAEELFPASATEASGPSRPTRVASDARTETIGDYLGVDGDSLDSRGARPWLLRRRRQRQRFIHSCAEFLLEKLAERPEARAQVHEAVAVLSNTSNTGDGASNLCRDFACDDLIEPVLRECFKPLARNGQIETLSSFAAQVRFAQRFRRRRSIWFRPRCLFETANLTLADDLAAARPVPTLVGSPAAITCGSDPTVTAAFSARDFMTRLSEAFSMRGRRRTTIDDESEALHGIALARIMGEQPDAREAVEELARSQT